MTKTAHNNVQMISNRYWFIVLDIWFKWIQIYFITCVGPVTYWSSFVKKLAQNDTDASESIQITPVC